MSIESELRALRNADGKYDAREITEWAESNPASELHKCGEYFWGDDGKAARLYRIGVTRKLIRVHILLDDGERGTVSLIQDRRTGGGYRDIQPVMTNAEMRSMLLRQALRELRVWQKKYEHLKELAAVFEAIPASPEPPAAAA